MSEVLDLDALLPEAKKVKLNGKVFDVYPATIRQLLRIQSIGQDISTGKLTGPEAEDLLINALSSIIPVLKEDTSVDLNIAQMVALIDFVQKQSVPQNEAGQAFSPQKKTVSSEA